MSRTGPGNFLDDLQHVAGTEAVEALRKACGGTRIYIPHQRVHRADSALARAFGGVEAASAIVAKLNAAGISRVNVDVPRGRHRLASAIEASVREGLLAGRPVAEVASKNGITERTVYRHRRTLVAERKLTKRQG